MVVFLSCLSGVAGWCLRGIEGMIFFCWLACQYQLGVKGMNRDTFLLGLYAVLILDTTQCKSFKPWLPAMEALVRKYHLQWPWSCITGQTPSGIRLVCVGKRVCVLVRHKTNQAIATKTSNHFTQAYLARPRNTRTVKSQHNNGNIAFLDNVLEHVMSSRLQFSGYVCGLSAPDFLHQGSLPQAQQIALRPTKSSDAAASER